MSMRAHLVVGGRVQGVCFRMLTCEEAVRRGITGWVRNRSDGTVEIVAEGEADALRGFVGWCRAGPSHARVMDVDESTSDATGEFRSFRIRY
ncbi:MAG: acylphosphatase [Lentisphaerae bacterium]|nr:acylphosphatase [Lentisphaerota bacterium]